MKIHQPQSPPAGLTYAGAVVDTAVVVRQENNGDGTVTVFTKTTILFPDTGERATLPIEFVVSSNVADGVPSPGQTFNVSAWR